jgi:hypothetical protein
LSNCCDKVVGGVSGGGKDFGGTSFSSPLLIEELLFTFKNEVSSSLISLKKFFITSCLSRIKLKRFIFSAFLLK